MIEKLKFKDHDEWLAIRSKYIGGSDAGAVVGMNPYKGPYELWLEKTGAAAPFSGNISTETGTYLEPFVAQLFERETGKKIRKDNHTMVNDLYPWACANVDRRIVGEDALLECKTTTNLPYLRLFKSGEYPEQWYCQMTHYLAVTGAKRIYLAVLILNGQFKVFPPLERDESEIAALMRAEESFWQHVKNGTPPAASAQDIEAINDVYPAETAVDDRFDLTAESDILSDYEAAKAEKKQAEARCAELQARICAALGNYTTGFTDKYKVTWKPFFDTRLDKDAFMAAHPEINLDDFKKTTPSRRFTFARIERK